MKTNSNPIAQFPGLYHLGTQYSIVEQLKKNQITKQRMERILNPDDPWSFQALLPAFARHEKYQDKVEATVNKYLECLKWVPRYLPYVHSPKDLNLEDIMNLKEQLVEKKLSLSRINHIMTALRMFLRYCSQVIHIPVIDYAQIKITKLPHHEIETLEEEDLNRFLEAINTDTLPGLRMRALAEYFISTCSRPTAALSVDYADINWDQNGIGEVTVVGKGNKTNILFITARAGEWIKQYLKTRTDSSPALFVTFGKAKRMTGNDLHKLFSHYSKKAGFDFTVNLQMLRRTMATIAQEKGADIYTVKEFLNQSRVETTIKHYVGRNKKVLKEAHGKYLKLA